jgi:hypothetical protein
MASRALLLRAAKMLDEQAELARESCQIGKRDWACADCEGLSACPTRKRHAELVRTANELRGPA